MPEPVVYEESDTRVLPFIGMTPQDFASVLITGLLAGLAAAVLYYLLDKFVFGAVLCRSQSTGDCSQAPNYAMIVAMIIATIGAVANLARLRIYRPLLVGIAAAISLWGLHTLLGNFAWYWALIAAMVIFMLTYAAFAWIAHVRNFILSLVITVVLVVVIRWVLVA